MVKLIASEALSSLQSTPASNVKKHGWRGVMQDVARYGKVLVTNHNTPEAVILSTAEYHALITAAQAVQVQIPAALETLRLRFDERLAVLNADDAGEKMRALSQQPATLDGKVKAGSSY